MLVLRTYGCLIPGQQRMIEDLKYQQEHQMLHNQLSNLESLKTEQVFDWLRFEFLVHASLL